MINCLVFVDWFQSNYLPAQWSPLSCLAQLMWLQRRKLSPLCIEDSLVSHLGWNFGVSPLVCFNGTTPKSPWRTHRARSDKTSVPFHDKNPTGSSSWGVENMQQISSNCPHRLWIPTAQKVSARCSRVGWASGRSFLLTWNLRTIADDSIKLIN